KLIDLFHARIALINHGNVDVAQSRRFDGWLLVLSGVVRQVNDGFYAEVSKSFVVFLVRPGASKKPIVHLAKVLDLNVWELSIFPGRGEARKCKDKRERCDKSRGRL